jgi:uncharacterized membrane-anchored protein
MRVWAESAASGNRALTRALETLSPLAMHTFLLVPILVFAGALAAQNDPPVPDAPKADAPKPDAPPATRSLKDALAKYHPQTGTVKAGTVATVKLGDDWLWLDGADGMRFLKDLGNDPSPVLGVAVPPEYRRSGVFAVYSYLQEGHIADDEAPDYDALLSDKKQAAVEESNARKQAGLKGVTLLGWAESPHYDKATHKLYWAERLQFEGNAGETLNYYVRVLGRTGHLVVNGVGSIRHLSLVAEVSKQLLEATEFVDGQRYTDFKPEYDKVATYGIGGLVAGGIALKTGLFAKLGLLLVKVLKPLLVGVALIGAWLVKLFRGGKKSDDAPSKAKA